MSPRLVWLVSSRPKYTCSIFRFIFLIHGWGKYFQLGPGTYALGKPNAKSIRLVCLHIACPTKRFLKTSGVATITSRCKRPRYLLCVFPSIVNHPFHFRTIVPNNFWSLPRNIIMFLRVLFGCVHAWAHSQGSHGSITHSDCGWSVLRIYFNSSNTVRIGDTTLSFQHKHMWQKTTYSTQRDRTEAKFGGGVHPTIPLTDNNNHICSLYVFDSVSSQTKRVFVHGVFFAGIFNKTSCRSSQMKHSQTCRACITCTWNSKCNL